MPTCNLIHDELKRLYSQCPERNLQEDLCHFLKCGYIFSGPTYLLMGERVGMGWFIHCAIGSNFLQKFAELMPYYLPFVGWAREQHGGKEVTWYKTENVLRRINMKLTPQQEFEKCRHASSNLVAQYRALAPKGFDPVAMGGTPSVPKPPAPPTANQASQSLLNQGRKRKPAGYASTILTGQGAGGSNPGTTSILGA